MTNEPTETRAQHLQWCKDRALKELDFEPDTRKACANAFASMGSDLGGHPDTANHAAIQLGMMMLMSNMPEAHDKERMRKFILGFH